VVFLGHTASLVVTPAGRGGAERAVANDAPFMSFVPQGYPPVDALPTPFANLLNAPPILAQVQARLLKRGGHNF
jgi:hypothetical protein